MIVSWDWLQQYVRLDVPVETLTERLTMSGLNLESVEPVERDVAIDLEVTSNRPDCLGHLGIAREAAVLLDRELTIPAAHPPMIGEKTSRVTSVTNECPQLCPQYFARVIRGVKVGPSPEWLQRRLRTLGQPSINNIVDITNYVLFERGQPLHAFDFDKLHDRRIVVRTARPGEKIVAINQREYELSPEMCVIADADRAVAVAGVMGGLDTEIGAGTANVLIESAAFAPLSIRNTARTLNLHSDSSYRFERHLDPLGLDWASRRCCELILEIAGGELLDEPVFAGIEPPREREPITLRFAQIRRILGIDVPSMEAVRILAALGLKPHGTASDTAAQFVPPSWRRDLTREIDLIEEVARIHGYEHIPEDAVVPLRASAKTLRDRITENVRGTLTAAGFYEAVTMSFVNDTLADLFTPQETRPRLRVEHSSRKQDNLLRQSLVPSLLESRRLNERHGTFNAQLFEIARVYLSAEPRRNGDAEPLLVSFVSGQPYAEVKGVVEALARQVNRAAEVTVRPSDVPQFAPGRGAEVLLNGQPWGWLGELDRSVTDRLDLRDAVTIAELRLSRLEDIADLWPTYQPVPTYQEVTRDLNFVLDESVTWHDLEVAVRQAAGPLLESISFGGQYRGKQIAEGKKSYLLTLHYRSPERTLTSEEVDAAQQAVIQACAERLGATLRA